MNRVIEEGIYFDISFFIIDEFHLILDEQRGYQLESLIAKIRSVEKILNKPNKYQIVGMSATLSGLDKLKEWLLTEIYECQYRPVPLSEYLQVGTRLIDKNQKLVLDFTTLPKLDNTSNGGTNSRGTS